MYGFAHRVGLVFLSVSLAVNVLPAHPDRRANAERFRALMEARAPFERWFIPGVLGHEPGKASLPVGEDAFRARSLVRLGVTPEGYWGRRNQLTELRGDPHNLADIFPPELFDEHPEFFPLVAGERWRPPVGARPAPWQPDLAEPGVVEHAASWVDAYFRENPEAWWVRMGTNDGLIYGDSEGVREWTYPPRWFRNKPDYSDLVFQFMNRVAEAVSPDWPGRHLMQLAYYWTENVPNFRVHPQILPYLATDQSQLYDPAYRVQEWALKERWGKSGARHLGLTDYFFSSSFLVPRQHLEMVAAHLYHARSVGFTDYHGHSFFNWGLDGPQPWVVAQLLVDPFQPLEPLLEEYYRRYFRGAAEPMRAFFEACERIWREQPGQAYWLKHFRNESQAELFPTAVNRELRALLDDAAARVRDDPVAAARVELTSAAFSVTEAFARFHEARQALADALMARMEASDPERLRQLLEAYEAARDDGSELRSQITDHRLRSKITDYGLRGGITDYGLEITNAGVDPSVIHNPESEIAGGPGPSVIHNPESIISNPGFLPVWHHVREHYPLAMRRTRLDVYLMHDPGPTAAALLADRVGDLAVPHPASPDLAWDLEAERTGGIELAGLDHRLDMPPGWSGSVEPFEGASAEFWDRRSEIGGVGVPPSGGPGTRLSITNSNSRIVDSASNPYVSEPLERESGPRKRGTPTVASDSSVIHNPKFVIRNQKRLEIRHWSAVPADVVGLASVEVRGRLSPSAFLLLRADWVNAERAVIGTETAVRLHEGDHPEWKPLRLFLDPPEGAAYLRYRLTAFHMMPGDELELREPAVEWVF